MNKLSFFWSLLATTTLLSISANATNIDEDILKLPHQEKSQAVKKAEIKASEDIGAFLGACVPQMRLLKEWVMPPLPNANQSQPLSVQSMIMSSQEDHDAKMTLFKENAARTIKELTEDGLLLMTDHSTKLKEKELGGVSANEMLATLFARIYETELFLKEISPSYSLHEQLKGYFIFHKTRQKEKDGLQKLHLEQQATPSLPEQKFIPQKDDREQNLLAMREELEKKFQSARKGVEQYHRLTVVLPNGTPDFSAFTTTEEESTSPLLSPRSSDSTSPKSTPSPSSSQDSVVLRGRAKTTSSPQVMTVSPKPSEELCTSSTPSPQSEKKKLQKEKRSGSMSEKPSSIVSPDDLQESPRFRTLSTATSSSGSSTETPDSSKSGSSPKKERSLLGSLKKSLSIKKRTSNEIKPSSGSSSRSSIGPSQD